METNQERAFRFIYEDYDSSRNRKFKITFFKNKKNKSYCIRNF